MAQLKKGKRFKTAKEQRLDRGQASLHEMIKNVSDETGYLEKDIKKVYVALRKEIKRQLTENKKPVSILGICFLIPTVRGDKKVNTFSTVSRKKGIYKTVQAILPPQWVLRFEVNGEFKRAFTKQKVTKADIDNNSIDENIKKKL